MKNKTGRRILLGLGVLLSVAFTVPFAPPDLSGGSEVSGWNVPDGVSETIVVPVSEEQLMEFVRQALSAGGAISTSIRKVDVDEIGTVYVATAGGRKAQVFARFVAQRVPCGDCHDVFFVYSFDKNGILKFVPVSITKIYNKKWDAADIGKIESRFVGKSLRTSVFFNPLVDAISSATMSSKIVFFNMNQTGTIYEKLVEKGVAEKSE